MRMFFPFLLIREAVGTAASQKIPNGRSVNFFVAICVLDSHAGPEAYCKYSYPREPPILY
jgi:hypothetical protein